MPERLRERTPTARKQHRCSLCTARIEVGEKYTRTTYVHDGRVYDWLTCNACETDAITNLAWEWSGGWDDEGVGTEQADEWAEQAVALWFEGAHEADRYRQRRFQASIEREGSQ